MRQLGLLLTLSAGLILGSGGAMSASVEPKVIAHGIAHDMLYGLSMEGRDGIAVGDFGLTFETADGGATWTKQAKPATAVGLFGVVRKQGHCIATGQNGLILTAADCKQWTVSAPVTQSRILSVAAEACSKREQISQLAKHKVPGQFAPTTARYLINK